MTEGQPIPEKPKFVLPNPEEFSVNMRVANNNYELTRLGGLRAVLIRQVEALDLQIEKVKEDSQIALGRINGYETMGTQREE